MFLISKKTLFWLLWIFTLISIWMLWKQGITRTFFHQDDVVELGVIATWDGWKTITHLNNEHLNITFWPLLFLQWKLFGVSYVPYLTLNILMHVSVMFILFLIAGRMTKSWFWRSLPVWGLVINPNWFAVVWWITGQMFFLTTIFALLSYFVLLKVREQNWRNFWSYLMLFVFSVLPGLSWGVGLTWPMWMFLVYGFEWRKKRVLPEGWILLIAQATLTVIYFSLIGKNLGVHTDPTTWLTNPLAVIYFVLVGISNTLVGRWIWPSENLKIRAGALVLTAIIIFSTKLWKYLADKKVLFGLVLSIGSFLTFAIPRWRFGIGHAMANYYAYFPLPFLLLSLSRLMELSKPSKWVSWLVLVVFLIHIPLSWIAFENWAAEYEIRPQQTRAYFERLNSVSESDCIENKFLPTYIVPQEIWKTDYLWPVFKKSFDPFCK